MVKRGACCDGSCGAPWSKRRSALEESVEELDDFYEKRNEDPAKWQSLIDKYNEAAMEFGKHLRSDYCPG